MANFEGTHETTLNLDHPLDVVRAHFSTLENIVAHSASVETARIEGDTIHFVLEEQDHGIAKFQGRYSCRYTLDGDTLTWETLGEGSTDQSGKATFEASGEGATTVHYFEKIVIDYPAPDMMAPMLQPVIGQVLASELKGYVKRVVAALS